MINYITWVKSLNIVYSDLISNDTLLERRRMRWSQKFNCVVTKTDFLKAFKNIYIQCIATKHRDFQYRLLTCSIPTNHKLYLWKINESQLCDFCGTEIEDEIHLFINCGRVQRIWNELKIYIEQNSVSSCENLEWSDKNIIFSQVHPVPSNIVNFLITITKQYIFRIRCTRGFLSGNNLIQEIENIYYIEANLAQRKNKWRRHKNKWGSIKEIPDPEEDYIQEYINAL